MISWQSKSKLGPDLQILLYNMQVPPKVDSISSSTTTPFWDILEEQW